MSASQDQFFPEPVGSDNFVLLDPVIERKGSFKKKLSVIITTPKEEKKEKVPYMSRYQSELNATSLVSVEVVQVELGSPSYLRARKRSKSR